jgi:hypothetical protein
MADEAPRMLEREQAVAAQRPLPERARHRLPALGSAAWLTGAEEASDLGIAEHRRIGREVLGTKRPEGETRAAQGRNREGVHAPDLTGCGRHAQGRARRSVAPPDLE